MESLLQQHSKYWIKSNVLKISPNYLMLKHVQNISYMVKLDAFLILEFVWLFLIPRKWSVGEIHFFCLPSIQKIDYLFIFLRLYFVIFNLSINDCNEKKGWWYITVVFLSIYLKYYNNVTIIFNLSCYVVRRSSHLHAETVWFLLPEKWTHEQNIVFMYYY